MSITGITVKARDCCYLRGFQESTRSYCLLELSCMTELPPHVRIIPATLNVNLIYFQYCKIVIAGFWETVPLGSSSNELSKTTDSRKGQHWLAELWEHWLLESLRRDPRHWNHVHHYEETRKHHTAMEHVVSEMYLDKHTMIKVSMPSQVLTCISLAAEGPYCQLLGILGWIILNLTSLIIARPCFQITSSTFLSLKFLYYLLSSLLFWRTLQNLFQFHSPNVFVYSITPYMKHGELTYNNSYETAVHFKFPWLATLSLWKGSPPWMRTYLLDLLLYKWAKNLIVGGGKDPLSLAI